MKTFSQVVLSRIVDGIEVSTFRTRSYLQSITVKPAMLTLTVTRMRPLLLMMFGSNIAEIRTETVELSAYWARPVSSSGASFFTLLVGNKGQRESRGIGNEARGTQERRKRRGEAPAKSCLFLLPAFVCAQI